ncbi:MAG: hypothetical protein JGK01_03040 [Microcoleus sp. PH2017_03_ELD_O_A]|uniref:hypothetical protein n=1 Tax=unclassified Microcoleus TaxID=2642155 RepID=UPI001E034A7D|nr:MULTISPECIES: hypothetical protein [unclassified Microcoleus]MCC3428836.1 hypothetical protein [Microcoleus sp. PH2017_04_SCI_O_A]MCC3440793.1 hypothetical protein [Microcoleus sp. PH2017_03_ELD_O_A]MCC3510723.1 hypothetical protein [Microcoleus sp. PH2017_17_BER_D_A]MCC3568172.1 hypothetical protein [Microcoleus sp. PH2017_31_RDM_U_A]
MKIRLFITPILFLLGRGRSQTVNCQLSTVNCQLSTVNCQLLKVSPEFQINVLLSIN